MIKNLLFATYLRPIKRIGITSLLVDIWKNIKRLLKVKRYNRRLNPKMGILSIPFIMNHLFVLFDSKGPYFTKWVPTVPCSEVCPLEVQFAGEVWDTGK